MNLKLGKYKHYKGNLYNVIGIGKHSETLEDMIVYAEVKFSTPNFMLIIQGLNKYYKNIGC